MEFIHGERLDLVWPSMTVEEKDHIFRQLRGILTTMRSIPSETALIGSCSGGVVRDSRQDSEYTGGPYADETTFNSSFYFDLVETTLSFLSGRADIQTGKIMPRRYSLNFTIKNSHTTKLSCGGSVPERYHGHSFLLLNTQKCPVHRERFHPVFAS